MRWVFARFYACAVGSACAFNRQMYLVDRSAEQWINARSFFGALWCISSPRLCGAQRGPVAGGTTRDGPVRAIRRPPLAFRQPSGLLASAARRPRSDGAIPCLCVGWMHDPASSRDGACAGLCWPIDKRVNVHRLRWRNDRGVRRATARGMQGA